MAHVRSPPASPLQTPARPGGPSKQIFVLKKQDFIGGAGTGVGPERPGVANFQSPNLQSKPCTLFPMRRWDGATCFRARARRSHFRYGLIAASIKQMFVFDDPDLQWEPISTAPFDRDLSSLSTVTASTLFHFDVAVPPKAGSAPKPERCSTRPTHWREWPPGHGPGLLGRRAFERHARPAFDARGRAALRVIDAVWPRPL